ncbi:hypothetical protein LEP1GSC044_0800 [Leptospira kirschneri serovar Grippotyphosa str. RM52]|uniref:Uncharacterized protein n=2 Tax=Leptospira kirschneri TaxID=29507 RepID=A0A0E2AXS5_9LEPT|nr:hypothetical protein LEP1GSC044_0800 [Leptospira kirschneri serovar Grippotyphosa str. RM52]EKO13732.1 hypothetical protein LEP1GSC081_3038 [Leptospira kirschneri str. H1]EKR07934.1 hypothetical protein LEP1GSC122_2179 [Leptospira kirschneri serovar Valbuzzi str. 200702274]EMJ91979.1 hypothetical protein LEP1GSC198_0374 [Leptospira kirschneri str. JB]EMK00765.1 hypothetical protein LEP1GSC176_0745 [Leptospira kirschneri str. MMD1493]EMK09080.1 hypothetical protein LEP1GSC166_0975 [Leptospir
MDTFSGSREIEWEKKENSFFRNCLKNRGILSFWKDLLRFFRK